MGAGVVGGKRVCVCVGRGGVASLTRAHGVAACQCCVSPVRRLASGTASAVCAQPRSRTGIPRSPPGGSTAPSRGSSLRPSATNQRSLPVHTTPVTV